MYFTAPIGSEEERKTGQIWPGRWINATGFGEHYFLGYHTGADLNLNYPHWDSDKHSDIFAIGDGVITCAKDFSVWGTIIIIDHGTVDGNPVFSRYAHVENCEVAVGQQVKTGELIAQVGNGDEEYPYHLHFDISTTDILRDNPAHWPGENKDLVYAHYVDPREWLQAHVVGDPNYELPATTLWHVINPRGVNVRKSHEILPDNKVGILRRKDKILLEDTAFTHQDRYRWGRIFSGTFHGDWVAVATADQSKFFLSTQKPD